MNKWIKLWGSSTTCRCHLSCNFRRFCSVCVLSRQKFNYNAVILSNIGQLDWSVNVTNEIGKINTKFRRQLSNFPIFHSISLQTKNHMHQVKWSEFDKMQLQLRFTFPVEKTVNTEKKSSRAVVASSSCNVSLLINCNHVNTRKKQQNYINSIKSMFALSAMENHRLQSLYLIQLFLPACANLWCARWATYDVSTWKSTFAARVIFVINHHIRVKMTTKSSSSSFSCFPFSGTSSPIHLHHPTSLPLSRVLEILVLN